MTQAIATAIAVPPSVEAYLTDPAVRAGVDALIGIKPTALPAGLERPELADYFAARAAAELTKFEWAFMLHRLWDATWGAAIGASWVPSSFDDLLVEPFAAVTPHSCWNDGWFSAIHNRAGHQLYTFVSVAPTATVIGFSLENDEGPLLQNLDGFEWHDTGAWKGWSAVLRSRRAPANRRIC